MADAGRRDWGRVEVAEKGRSLTVWPGKEIHKRISKRLTELQLFGGRSIQIERYYPPGLPACSVNFSTLC